MERKHNITTPPGIEHDLTIKSIWGYAVRNVGLLAKGTPMWFFVWIFKWTCWYVTPLSSNSRGYSLPGSLIYLRQQGKPDLPCFLCNRLVNIYLLWGEHHCWSVHMMVWCGWRAVKNRSPVSPGQSIILGFREAFCLLRGTPPHRFQRFECWALPYLIHWEWKESSMLQLRWLLLNASVKAWTHPSSEKHILQARSKWTRLGFHLPSPRLST